MMESRTLYVVFTNTDLTEGRGWQYPIGYSFNEYTALRVAKKKGVMGTDGDVSGYPTLIVDGKEYVPVSLLNIQRPEQADIDKEQADKKRKETVARLLEAGADPEDLKALGVKI